MIQSQAFVAALPFANQAANKGKVIAAAPNTLLSELVRLSVPPQDVTVQSEDGLGTYGNVLQAVTEGTLENPTLHSLELDGAINDLVPLVTKHVSHAKNVVKPLVVAMAERIAAYCESNTVKDASVDFTIDCLNYPAVLNDESFLDTLSAYKGKSVLTPDARFKLENKPSDELMKMVLIGHDRTDRLIVEWLSQQPEGFLNDVWSSFFTNLDGSYSYQTVNQVNPYLKVNIALAVYLFSLRLYADVQNTDLNLSQYKEIALQYRDYAGALLTETIKMIALYTEAKTLIVENDSRSKTVRVNGLVYKNWLKSGGKPETILGVLVSSDRVTKQSLIDEQTEKYTKAWESYNTFYKTNESVKAFDYLKSFLSATFVELLKQLDESEQAYIQKNPQHLETTAKLVNEYLDQLKNDCAKDIYGLALGLIAKCRFYYTSAYSILSDINEAGKVNPNVDVREAALLAVINYLADYLSVQMVVNN